MKILGVSQTMFENGIGISVIVDSNDTKNYVWNIFESIYKDYLSIYHGGTTAYKLPKPIYKKIGDIPINDEYFTAYHIVDLDNKDFILESKSDWKVEVFLSFNVNPTYVGLILSNINNMIINSMVYGSPVYPTDKEEKESDVIKSNEDDVAVAEAVKFIAREGIENTEWHVICPNCNAEISINLPCSALPIWQSTKCKNCNTRFMYKADRTGPYMGEKSDASSNIGDHRSLSNYVIEKHKKEGNTNV